MVEKPSSPQTLRGRTIVLGVTGSIAAYKAADLTSLLVKAGAAVHVVMTEAATRIVAPVTLQTLSRQPVLVDMWDPGPRWQPQHIDLADQADLLVVAPATAHTLACFARGLAPNLLCTLYLATQAPVLLAPAMNGKMLAHPATQENLRLLEDRGHHLMETDEGMLACGYEGKGKLAAVDAIFQRIEELLHRRP